jgi:hypothetical protein
MIERCPKLVALAFNSLPPLPLSYTIPGALYGRAVWQRRCAGGQSALSVCPGNWLTYCSDFMRRPWVVPLASGDRHLQSEAYFASGKVYPALSRPSPAGSGADWFRRSSMAKGQKRSNREQKKPKQQKPKEAVAQSAFTALHERPAAPTPTKKK